jgi:hypothetical protein
MAGTLAVLIKLIELHVNRIKSLRASRIPRLPDEIPFLTAVAARICIVGVARRIIARIRALAGTDLVIVESYLALRTHYIYG